MPERRSSDAAYLEAASRIIFMGGLNRRVVERKWPGFREAFAGFDPVKVAAMTAEEVERLAHDDRVIRYRAKLQAVVDNAATMVALGAPHGSFGAYVEALLEGGVPAAAGQLAAAFAYISEEGARNWLYSTGHDVGPVSDKVARKYAPFEA